MKRRNFLKLASTSCASLPVILTTACTHKQFYNPDQDIIIGGGQFKKNDAIHHVLAISNLHQRDTQLINTKFLPHEILVDPNDKKRLIIFEKNGTHAAAVDLNSHEVIAQYSAKEMHNFSGHAAFDRSGKLIYSIESNTGNAEGKVIVRDSKYFQIIKELPTYGKNPQACKLIRHDKTQKPIIVVTNRGSDGSQASIVYIDTQTNKLLDEIKLEGGSVNSCHFAISKNDSLIVATLPNQIDTGLGAGSSNGLSDAPGDKSGDKLAQVRISNPEHAFTRMSEPTFLTEKLIGEAPSICIDVQHDMAAITHPEANLLTFWSIRNQSLVKAISVPNPRGITLTLNGKYYIVSYGVDTSSILIHTKDLSADKDSIMQPIFASGEHIINWSKTLTEIMPGNIYS